MQLVLVYGYQILFAFSLFILISLGLAVIFGMMRVINLAQGEFIMLGAYGCTVITNAGSPLWLSIILSGLIVGAIGILAERTVIRFLYGRVLDTLLATWGLSLLIVGIVTTVFGPQTESVPQTLGKVTVGDFAIATYSLLMIVIAFGLLAATYALWRYTKVGLVVRGTMQNPTMARALGVNTERVYMLTFGFGAMLTGLAGAILVPLFGASPTMGVFYVAKAFITVISGGHLPLLGTLSASGLFGSIDGLVSYTTASVLGEIAVLVVAIVLLRLLPQGITGRLRQGL
ncbi:MAG: branched-chain amino acid ABC transporter permease [Kiloniellales bacterium]|nr:branched-chain amino acid ABC transporter permease [Kiloniellales bacterium]